MSEVLRVDSGVIEFPTSDGKPAAETPLHYDRLSDLAHCVKTFFSGRADAYVGVDMLVYDNPNAPRGHLSPDIFVAFGTQVREREIYKLWEDPPPAFVLELTSKSTRGEDERKKVRYARWGVAEYFLYDPRGEYLAPALQGFALSGAGYRSTRERILSNGERGFSSATLGLELWLDGPVLRLYDPVAGENLATPEEWKKMACSAAYGRRVAEARARSAEDGKRVAEARARVAEAELAELRAQIAATASPRKNGG